MCELEASNNTERSNKIETLNFSLDMVLSPQNVSMKPRGGLRSPKGGPPPLYMKKTSMSKNDFQTIWSKKNKKKLDMENDPC